MSVSSEERKKEETQNQNNTPYTHTLTHTIRCPSYGREINPEDLPNIDEPTRQIANYNDVAEERGIYLKTRENIVYAKNTTDFSVTIFGSENYWMILGMEDSLAPVPTIAFNRHPPHMNTEVPYERTKAEIEVLLRSYGVKGIRWTSLEGRDDILEFIVEAEVQGIKKQLGIAVKPSHIYNKKKIRGQPVDAENINHEYRLLFQWIKSKIEAVVRGLSTIEKEFLSEVQLKVPNSRESTVSEVVIDLMGQNTVESLPFYNGQQQHGQRVNDPKIIDVTPSKEDSKDG